MTSEKVSEDPNKPLIAGILSFFIPGAGQWFIHSPRAQTYFLYWLGLVVAAMVIFFITFGLCFPVMFLPTLLGIGAAIDAYYEARGEDDKRVLKSIIK
ncbi:MAG: hypothetical protein V1728_01225 [Candidatus Micrarchaeota archaeon]